MDDAEMGRIGTNRDHFHGIGKQFGISTAEVKTAIFNEPSLKVADINVETNQFW